VAGELSFQPPYIQLYICGLRLYISKNNQDNQSYFNSIKRPKTFGRVAGNILEVIDLFSNSVDMRENILYS
jgi:hypothetical protein